MTLTAHETARFCDAYIASGAGDLADALMHLHEQTGIRTQHVLWLYSGKVATVTR